MLYLSGIILSYFLSFLLLTKKHKSIADYLLVAWLIVLGCHLSSFYLMHTGQDRIHPALVALGMPLPLAHGPFLYLYTRQQTSRRPFTAVQLLHFLPLLASYAMFASFYFLPFGQQVEVFAQKGRGFELQTAINVYAIYASGVAYTSLSLYRLLRYRRSMLNEFSNTEKINFNWLLYLIIWMVVIWTVVLFVQRGELIFGAAALFAIWIAYFSIRQQRVYAPPMQVGLQLPIIEKGKADVTVSEVPVPEELILEVPVQSLKYQKSTLSEDEAAEIHERLQALMAERKPYTNPDLTLNDLATSLAVHPNILSQVINSREGRSFYDLVNAGRVEEFIRRAGEPGIEQYTLLSIAFDCGFNSKASFNRNFKKYTGQTPSEYLSAQLV
jgi:AraC-like DNA-binding protein